MSVGPPSIHNLKSDTLSYQDQELIESGRMNEEFTSFLLYDDYATCYDKLVVTAATKNLFDPILPKVLSVKANPETNSIDGSTISWKIEFSKSIKNLTIDNFALLIDGEISDAYISSVIPLNAEINTEFYTEWLAYVSTGTGSGKLGLNITNSTDIKDLEKNSLLFNETFVGEQVFVRSTGPIASISIVGNNVSNDQYVKFLISSDTIISNLSANNLQLLVDETLTDVLIDSISNIDDSWEVTVNTGTGYGHISLQIVNNDGIYPEIFNLNNPSKPFIVRQPLIEKLDTNPTSEKIFDWKITFFDDIERVYKSNFKLVSNNFESIKITNITKLTNYSWKITGQILDNIDHTLGSGAPYEPVYRGSIGLNLDNSLGLRSLETNMVFPEFSIDGPIYSIYTAKQPPPQAITSVRWNNAELIPAIVNYTDLSTIGIYYLDEVCGVGDLILDTYNPAVGVMFSVFGIKGVNTGVSVSREADDTLSTYLQTTAPSGDNPAENVYHVAVGVASNELDILNAPNITTLNLIYKDIVSEDDYGSGAGLKILNNPGIAQASFSGDDHKSMVVAASFDSNEQYCELTYRSTFSCKPREWSDPVKVDEECELDSPPIEKDWYLIDPCTAERTKVCIQRFCMYMPNPAPPKFQALGCCEECVWNFKKVFNCDTQEWECVEATVECKAGGGDGTWAVNGCEATTSIALEIPCKGASDCPQPDCTQAPPGPFTKPISECCENDTPGGGGDDTQCVPCVGNCKFLGCSVVGFNGSIGWNTQESTVNIDLVEVQCDIDGTGSPPEVFTGANLIGYPVYFYCGGFFFGGLMQNWTYNSNAGGRTYNVKLVDPRQILEQCVLIIDTYAGPPVRTLNYFNVYGFYEEDVYKNKNCDLFGTSESTERGMPYNKIMYALKNMNPVICTPVGANLTIDWSTFNIPVPEYFKIAGPSITILQLIVDICDEAGYDFFVTLEPGDIVRIYPVSLKQYDPIEDNLFFGFTNVIDFTYGKELRIAKTRNLLFGEQQHYLDVVYFGTEEQNLEAEVQYVFNGVTGEKEYSSRQPGDNTDPFEFYFGEEVNPETGEATPIVPYKREFGQFWVNIDIRKLNVNLIIPFPVDRMNICEYDIRTAMTSFESFWSWTAHEETPSELGKAIQANWPVTYSPRAVLTRLNQSAVTLPYALADAAGMPNSDRATFNLHQWPPILEDIKKVHEWIAEFGRTYYGRQYLVKLNEKICVKDHPENFGEKMYTDTPTNDGGWVEPGIPVMGLKDPDLGLFRTDDDRVGSFALFCNPENLSDILLYSGSGGGDYEYTLGSGILDISEPPPSGSGV